MHTRTLYVTYSLQMPNGTGDGRNTVTLSSSAPLPDLLSMADIRKIEEDNLRIVRETHPDAKGLHLTWWAEVRPEAPPPTQEP